MANVQEQIGGRRTQAISQGFGEYFAELIRSGNYRSQNEIASAIGVSTRTLSCYLNGERTPSVATCEQIAFAFGISIAEVRAAAGKPSPTSIDGVFSKHIRSLMLGMDWTSERLQELTDFLERMDEAQWSQ